MEDDEGEMNSGKAIGVVSKEWEGFKEELGITPEEMEAARAELLEEWSKIKEHCVCDCTKNYDGACKHPEDYRNRGCK